MLNRHWLGFRRSYFLLLSEFFDAKQLMLPKTFKLGGPLVQRPDGRGVGSVILLTAVAAHPHQTNIAQDTQVLRNRWLPQTERRHNVPDRSLPHRQIIEDLAAAGFRH